jgi:hypothetical protein
MIWRSEKMVLKRFSKRTWFALWIFAVALIAVVATYAYLLNKQKSASDEPDFVFTWDQMNRILLMELFV